MRPETFAAMADDGRGVRAPALPASVGERSGAGVDAPWLHRRALPRPARRRTLRRSRSGRQSTDIIVGFPGETDADFERTLEVAAAAEYDYAYQFIFSPRQGTEAAEMVDDFVDPAVAGERFKRLKIVVERSAFAQHRGACRANRRGARRRPVEKTRGSSPAGHGRTSWSTSPRQPRPNGQLRHRRDHPRRPAPPRGPIRRADRRARPTSCDPGRRPLTWLAPVRSSVPPPPESRRWRWRSPNNVAPPNWCRSIRCRCTAGWTSGPPSRALTSNAGSAPPGSTSSMRIPRFTVVGFQRHYRDVRHDLTVHGVDGGARRWNRAVSPGGDRRT